MTQLNIAYNWNIINKSTLAHALLLVVLRPSLPPSRPTLPKPSLPRPSLPRPTLLRPSLPTPWSVRPPVAKLIPRRGAINIRTLMDVAERPGRASSLRLRPLYSITLVVVRRRRVFIINIFARFSSCPSDVRLFHWDVRPCHAALCCA